MIDGPSHTLFCARPQSVTRFGPFFLSSFLLENVLLMLNVPRVAPATASVERMYLLNILDVEISNCSDLVSNKIPKR